VIVIRLTEASLRDKDACADGIALWREIAKAQDEVRVASGKRPRKVPCVRVEWTPLAAVWLAVGFPGFAGWLRDVGLVPTSFASWANLSRADLSGAWRYDSDPPLAGWVLVGNRLARASDTCVCGHSKADHGDVGAICGHCDCTTFRPRAVA